jgi:hypothetical protein
MDSCCVVYLCCDPNNQRVHDTTTELMERFQKKKEREVVVAESAKIKFINTSRWHPLTAAMKLSQQHHIVLLRRSEAYKLIEPC